jgi:hypothetical protein
MIIKKNITVPVITFMYVKKKLKIFTFFFLYIQIQIIRIQIFIIQIQIIRIQIIMSNYHGIQIIHSPVNHCIHVVPYKL